MKIRIEIEDKGLKSTYEFETQSMEREALREKIVGYLTAANIFSESDESACVSREYDSNGTLMGRIEQFIRYEFPDNWFTSQELKERYETVADDIKLSTVSTYLSRMNRDGLLERKGNRNNRQYRLLSENSQNILNQENSYQSKKKVEDRW
ncbi:MAG: hypothetical protein ACE14P_00460 [Methanotrichaceae archaeon]